MTRTGSPRPGDALERPTTAGIVADRLRSEILRGQISPGTRLRQNDVARRFAVSTTPVREALAQLQAEGMVRVDPHRGAVAFRPTVEDVIEFYEMREALETLAIVHTIGRLDATTAEALGELVEQMRHANDAGTWLRLNDEFHLRLYACAGRPRLVAHITKLRDASAPYTHLFVASRPPNERSNDEHQAILDACLAGDVQAARRAIKEHMHNASRDLAAFLRARSGDSDD
jgi:DNA-binding GntR family transcriptional regulator